MEWFYHNAACALSTVRVGCAVSSEHPNTTTFTKISTIMNSHERLVWENRFEIPGSVLTRNEKRRVERQLKRGAMMDISDLRVGSRV